MTGWPGARPPARARGRAARVRPSRRPDHARARRALRRAVDPVRDHPPRAGHHLPGRRVRPRRRPPRRGVRRARRRRLQRRRGAGHRVRGVVAGGARRRPDQPRRHRQGPRAAARDRRPARPRAPDHRRGSGVRSPPTRSPTPCTRRSCACSAAAGSRSRSRCRRRRSRRRPTITLLDRADDVRVAADPEQIAAAAARSPAPSDR